MPRQSAIKVELGLNIVAGRQIQLVDPVIYVNQEEVPQQIVDAIASNLNIQLDLANKRSLRQRPREF